MIKRQGQMLYIDLWVQVTKGGLATWTGSLATTIILWAVMFVYFEPHVVSYSLRSLPSDRSSPSTGQG